MSESAEVSVAASAGRIAWKMPVPISAPRNALTAASTDEMTATCSMVAPTRRSAAYRSSRRAAARRVAVPTRMRIGNKNAIAPTMKASRK